MTLIKWSPRANMFNFFDAVDSIVNNFPSDRIMDGSKDLSFVPLANISETISEYSISLDIPGLSKKDIQIAFEDSLLKISGERKLNDIKNDSSQLCSELNYGKFIRLIKLPSDVVVDKVNAKYSNGVLNIILPKSKSTSKKIVIS